MTFSVLIPLVYAGIITGAIMLLTPRRKGRHAETR